MKSAVRWRFVLGGLVALTVLGACGGGDPQLVLPPRPSEASTSLGAVTTTVAGGSPGTGAPAATAGAGATADPWTDATGNLVGTPSECGTLTLVSAQPGTDVVLA